MLESLAIFKMQSIDKKQLLVELSANRFNLCQASIYFEHPVDIQGYIGKRINVSVHHQLDV